MANFHGGKSLEICCRKFLAEFAQHFDVVVERMVGMEASDDVQFAGAVVNGFGGLVADCFVIPVVSGRAVFFDAAEGAEFAVQHTHVRVVDLAVVHPIDGLAVARFFFGVGAGAEFIERCIQK